MMENSKPLRFRGFGLRAARGDLWALIPWSITVVAGFAALAQYAYTPGAAGAPSDEWPAESSLNRRPDRVTLLVFLHPRCPCSRASVAELRGILERSRGAGDTRILFVRPRGVPAGWEQTDLWSSAAEIPGVAVGVDPDGAEARRFGVATSGSAMLYDPSGRLIFRGGITGARGHSGANVGASAVLAGLLTGHADPPQTPVFGCPLFASEPLAAEETAPCHR